MLFLSTTYNLQVNQEVLPQTARPYTPWRPKTGLQLTAHEAPLQLRCEKLALQYYTKLKSWPFSPTYDCILNFEYEQHFEKKEKSIKPFGLGMQSTLKESIISLNDIHESILP